MSPRKDIWQELDAIKDRMRKLELATYVGFALVLGERFLSGWIL
jgi:hypothetical protein